MAMKVCTTLVNEVAETVTIHFSNGDERVYATKDLPNEMRVYAMLDRIRNKLVDTFAAKSKEGIGACIAAADAAWSNLVANEWDARGGRGVAIDVEALFRVARKGRPETTLEQVAELWAKATDAKQKEFRALPAFQVAKNEIIGERIAARSKDADDGSAEIAKMFE
jgi:hypothetical protein